MDQRIAALHAEARKNGWAITDTMDVSSLAAWSRHLGWRKVPNRRGGTEIDELTPTTEDDAHPKSLSATYGLRAQPFHTDGAQLRRPPDLVALHSVGPSDTPTLLWKPGYPPAHVSHGVFLVDAGSDRFLATPFSLRSGFRFDPGCMTPCDQRAREAVAYFAIEQSSVVQHEWTSADQVLLIDNRHVLRARAAVAPGDDGRRLERVSFEVESKNV